MGLICYLLNSFMFLWCLFVLSFNQVHSQPHVFDLIKYGGVSSKTFDNSKALLRAWNDACKWNGEGKAQIVIPSGRYLLNPVQLIGPCKRPIKIINKGHLLAPPGPTNLKYWIEFRYVDGLTINGGVYDGQGQTVWDRSRGQIDPGHALVSLNHVSNGYIRKVRLTNSKLTHLNLFGCNNLEIEQSSISAPENSPNTDGIKMASTKAVNIRDVKIASGDDCVAILAGTSNLNITEVQCGPGHGISIGSMGWKTGEVVKGVIVTHTNFTGTTNGVRIKSWANRNSGVCADVSFKNIHMNDVRNPIIIDQHYCPPKSCSKGDSHVQIYGVHFMNIKGTSTSEVGINLECSKSNPCKNIRLDNIDLIYTNKDGTTRPATSLCSNARGIATRVKNIGSCLSHN